MMARRVERYKVDCHWYETGNPEDFLKATAAGLKILNDPAAGYPHEYLRSALARFSKETPVIEMREGCSILKAPSAAIDKNVQLSGFAVLGAGSKIQSGSVLRNAVVADRIQVAPDTHAENLLFLENN